MQPKNQEETASCLDNPKDKEMAKKWEITGRLGELQLAWLRAHYTQEELDEALARLPKKGFPLNVARRLEAAGGPKMPSPAELLAADQDTNDRP